MGIMEHISPGSNAITRRFRLVCLPLLLAVTLLASCDKDETVIPVEPESPKDVILIRYGVFANGLALDPCKYCVQETAATKNDIVYVEKGADSIYGQPRLKRIGITREEWNDLVGSINVDSVATVDSNQVRGHTNMAENEWIEVETGLMKKRVVFDYGASVQHLDSLIVKMRALHALVQI